LFWLKAVTLLGAMAQGVAAGAAPAGAAQAAGQWAALARRRRHRLGLAALAATIFFLSLSSFAAFVSFTLASPDRAEPPAATAVTTASTPSLAATVATVAGSNIVPATALSKSMPWVGRSSTTAQRTESLVGMEARGGSEQDGPLGDWVECEISYTPTVSMLANKPEPRRTDSYVFHKLQLREDFGHLYAKLGFTIQTGVIYRDVETRCFEPDNLEGQCSDCFKFMFGGAIGFVGTTSAKYYQRPAVSLEECVGDTAQLRAEADALPYDKSRPDTSIWCMRA